MMVYLLTAIAVFVLNIIPAFAPATWTVLSFVAINFGISLLPLAIIGAASATLGRLVLTKMARVVIRQKILSEKIKHNIDDIRKHLETRKVLTFSIFLFYAFSPFPSNQLFIAYGLTDMKLKLIALPFFLGRTLSYLFLTFSVSEARERFFPHSINSIFSIYFIFAQLATIGVVYLFTRINWHELLTKRKIKFIR